MEGMLSLSFPLISVDFIPRTAATAALGDHSHRRAVKVGSCSQAKHEFSTWYMEGKIVTVLIE